MMTLDLQATPNQSLTFNADGQQYGIRIWSDDDDMSFMDVSLNGVPIAYSCPCIVGQQVIPYSYLEGAGGNFFFTTASGDNPQWRNFGAGDVLLYGTNAEIAAQRAANVTAAETLTLGPNQNV